MPFAGYENFDACVLDQQDNGEDEESARRICGRLQADAEAEQDGQMHEALTLSDGSLAVLFDMPAEPPRELMLFDVGETPTTKGTVLFDDESAVAVPKQLAEHGRKKLPFDYEHGMLAPIKTSETGKAAAWFRPEVREGALWAADIKWTPKAAQGIADREWQYFSPAVLVDKATRRVMRLVNVALTNLPATIGMVPIAASETTPDAEGAEGTEDTMSELLKALGASDDAEALEMLNSLTHASDAMFELLSVSTFSEAEAAVKRLQEQVQESTKLAERVAVLESEAEAKHKAAIIAKLSESGKAPPSVHPFLQTLTVEQLQTYSDAVPAVDQPNSTPPAEESVVISDTAKQLCKSLGVSEEAWVATRKAEVKE